jgi:hypothetical protein
MKLTDVVIASEKLTRYLLVRRPRGDKSGYLAKGGFTQENPEALKVALLEHAKGDAEEGETDRFGTRYRIEGELSCPNGQLLRVATIWLRKTDGRTHFVTLVPRRRQGGADV